MTVKNTDWPPKHSLRFLAEDYPLYEPLLESNKILVVESWASSPHIETGIEIALRLLLDGKEVHYLQLSRLFSVDEVIETIPGSLTRLMYYAKRRLALYKSYRLLGDISLVFPRLQVFRPSVHHEDSPFVIRNSFLESIDALKHLSLDDSPLIGLSIASALISITKNSAVLPSRFSKLCNRMADGYHRAYAYLMTLTSVNHYDAVVAFNGRFPSSKVVMQCCLSRKIPVMYHERGPTQGSYSLFPYQPHDRIAMQLNMLSTWEKCMRSAKSKDYMQYASYFYIRNRFGGARDSFTSSQRNGLVDSLLSHLVARSSSKVVVSFFTTSEDELAAVDDAYRPVSREWATQAESIRTVSEICASLGYAFIVRVHPNVANKDPADQARWLPQSLGINSYASSIVHPSSPLSSYELLLKSDVIVTYGSTMGIEAVYWGKPSISLANSYYDSIGSSVYFPTTAADLRVLLSEPGSLVVDQDSALSYGYYRTECNHKFVIYKPCSPWDGHICGINFNSFTLPLWFVGGFRPCARAIEDKNFT